MRRSRILVLVYALASGCTTADSSRDTRSARQLLASELVARFDSVPVLRDDVSETDSMEFVERPSRAIAGLRYVRGSYRPPDTFDATVTAVAGETGESAGLLRSPQDWSDLVGSIGWFPKGEAEAIEACSELVTFAGPRQARTIPPLVYRDSTVLSGAPSREVPLAPELAGQIRARAKPPKVTAGSGDWTVALWMIEVGRSTEYRCSFARQSGKLSVTLSEGDSIPRAGLLTAPSDDSAARKGQ